MISASSSSAIRPDDMRNITISLKLPVLKLSATSSATSTSSSSVSMFLESTARVELIFAEEERKYNKHEQLMDRISTVVNQRISIASNNKRTGSGRIFPSAVNELGNEGDFTLASNRSSISRNRTESSASNTIRGQSSTDVNVDMGILSKQLMDYHGELLMKYFSTIAKVYGERKVKLPAPKVIGIADEDNITVMSYRHSSNRKIVFRLVQKFSRIYRGTNNNSVGTTDSLNKLNADNDPPPTTPPNTTDESMTHDRIEFAFWTIERHQVPNDIESSNKLYFDKRNVTVNNNLYSELG